MCHQMTWYNWQQINFSNVSQAAFCNTEYWPHKKKTWWSTLNFWYAKMKCVFIIQLHNIFVVGKPSAYYCTLTDDSYISSVVWTP